MKQFAVAKQCGGGRFTAGQSIIILNNTLTARISQ